MRKGEPDTDALLHDLLSIAERSPDEAFVLRVQRLALAEQKLRVSRRAAIFDFAVQTAGLIAITAAFLLIRVTATVVSDGPMFSGSAAASLMLLLIWLCVDAGEFRPFGSGAAEKRS